MQRGLAVRLRSGDRGREPLARPHDLVARPGPPLVEVGDDVRRRAGEVVELGGGGHPATLGRRGSGLGHPALGVGQHGRDLVGERPRLPGHPARACRGRRRGDQLPRLPGAAGAQGRPRAAQQLRS